MPISPIADVAKANDKFRGSLRSTWIASPADTSLLVDAVPENVPTYIVVGWETDLETVFRVEGKSGTNASNYALTGVTRVKGANTNLPENTPVNCLNNEEFFNQYEEKINSIIDEINDALAVVNTVETLVNALNLIIETGYISLPAASLSTTTTSPCASIELKEAGTNDVDYKVLAFDKATEEYAFTMFDMPDYWDAGTLSFQFKWTTAAATGDVIFGVKGRAFADNDALDQAYGTAVTVTDSVLAASDVHVSSWTSAMTLAGTPAGGQSIQLKFYRKAADAADTLDADALLIGIRIKFTVNTG